MNDKKILFLMGSVYHDAPGFARYFVPRFTRLGYLVETTTDPNTLLNIPAIKPDLVMLYICPGTSPDGEEQADLTAEQTGALAGYVRSGGGLLALHQSTVIQDDNPVLEKLLGGRFISHPPLATFEVTPLVTNHPVVWNSQVQRITDEFYIHRTGDDITVLMEASHDGQTQPMAWVRQEGAGRVAYLAPGHDERVWDLQWYHTLLFQAAGWVSPGGEDTDAPV